LVAKAQDWVACNPFLGRAQDASSLLDSDYRCLPDNLFDALRNRATDPMGQFDDIVCTLIRRS
jgi:hypothetical protein